MAYIGTKPTIGNFQICDAISVVNGQAAYTMQVGSVNVIPQSANHMIVSLNGTIQKPNSSFTVSSSTITFSSNLSTGDVIDFIQILGDVLDLGVPSDATVTAAKLNNDIISGTTALTSEPADTDEFLVSDAGTLKRIDYSLIKGGSSNAFHAYDMSSNASGTLVLTSELLDDGSNYNTSNGRYTAPSAGKYHFYCSAVASTSSGDSYINFHLNGSVINGGTDQGGNTPNQNTQGIMIATIDLSANDYITMVSQNSVYSNYIFFGGYKLY